jgi:hypothetical protein
MNRSYLAFGAVPAMVLIAGSCAPLGSASDTGDSDSGTSSTEEAGSTTPPQDGGSGVGQNMGSGSPDDTGTPFHPDAASSCVIGGAGPASLPFHVDQYFISSGWEQAQYIQAGPACTRPSGGSVDAGGGGSVSDGGDGGSVSDRGDGGSVSDGGDGSSVSDGGDDSSVADAGTEKCWTWTYAPGGLSTWAGVDWQYPVNNWGTAPGLAIPAGATAVTFYAWGATGTEIVTFNVGYGPTSTDVFGASLANQHLTTTPTQYSISLTGDDYVCNSARMGFGWTAAGATSETFYIDSITWQ